MKADHRLDARRLDHHSLETLRERAVAAVERGWPAGQVAQILGLNRRTVFRWVADYRRGGLEALRAKPIPGRPRGKGKVRDAAADFADRETTPQGGDHQLTGRASR